MSSRRKYNLKQRLKKQKAAGIELISCKICGLEMRRLNAHLRDIHRMKDQEYAAQFPGEPLYASDYTIKAAKARSNSYKAGNYVCYNTGKTKYNCEAVRITAEKIAIVKKGKLPPQFAGLPPWTRDLPLEHPYREKMSKIACERILKNNNKSISVFKEDLGFSVRSKFEANFVRFLKYENIDFKYEGTTFKLTLNTGKSFRYIPDFYIKCESYEGYIELKGYDKLKIPKWNFLLAAGIPLVCIKQNSLFWKTIEKNYCGEIKEWELSKNNNKILVPFNSNIDRERYYIGESLKELYSLQGNAEERLEASKLLKSVEAICNAPHEGEDMVRS